MPFFVGCADLRGTQHFRWLGLRTRATYKKLAKVLFTRTVVVVSVTRNLRRAGIPGTFLIPAEEGGLSYDSVALCYQIVVLDREGLQQKLGTLSPDYLLALEQALKYTLELS